MFQVQAQKSSETRWGMPGPTAMTKDPGTDQSVETMTLKGPTGRTDEHSAETSPGSSPKIPHCKREIQGLSTCTSALAVRSSWCHFLFLLLPPTHPSFFTGTDLLKSNAMDSLSQANPLNLSPRPPFFWLPTELRHPSPGSPVASSLLSPSLFHCSQL